jgi:hypothetical protein
MLGIQVTLCLGTTVELAAAEMSELAGRLGLLVEAKFNGLRLRAYPGETPADVLAAFKRYRGET